MDESDPDRPEQALGSQILGSLRKLGSRTNDDQLDSDPVDRLSDSENSTDRVIIEALQREISRREQRGRLFPDGIFGEPAWNIILDLYQSSIAKRRVTVSDACIASGAPNTTALRWIDVLAGLQLVERRKSGLDRRVIYLHLTASAEEKLNEYFSNS